MRYWNENSSGALIVYSYVFFRKILRSSFAMVFFAKREFTARGEAVGCNEYRWKDFSVWG